jgi:hypothetical protein
MNRFDPAGNKSKISRPTNSLSSKNHFNQLGQSKKLNNLGGAIRAVVSRDSYILSNSIEDGKINHNLAQRKNIPEFSANSLDSDYHQKAKARDRSHPRPDKSKLKNDLRFGNQQKHHKSDEPDLQKVKSEMHQRRRKEETPKFRE